MSWGTFYPMAEMQNTQQGKRQILDFMVDTYSPDGAIDFQSEMVRSELIELLRHCRTSRVSGTDIRDFLS